MMGVVSKTITLGRFDLEGFEGELELLENLVHTIYSIIFLLVDDFCVELRCGYILVS